MITCNVYCRLSHVPDIFIVLHFIQANAGMNILTLFSVSSWQSRVSVISFFFCRHELIFISDIRDRDLFPLLLILDSSSRLTKVSTLPPNLLSSPLPLTKHLPFHNNQTFMDAPVSFFPLQIPEEFSTTTSPIPPSSLSYSFHLLLIASLLPTHHFCHPL